MTSTTTQTKSQLRSMATEIKEATIAKGTHVFVGTWMDRPGLSITIRFQSKSLGDRVVIHKWDGEEICTVRYVTGDAWRDPDNARTFASAEAVPFTVSDIVAVINTQVSA